MISDLAERLYKEMPFKCWMTEKNLAKLVNCRVARIKDLKEELESAGLIHIRLFPNGNRSNPRHEITKFKRPRRSPICKHIRESFCLSEWDKLERNELVECYIKSRWEIVPFRERSKRPIEGFCVREWKNLLPDQKMEFFFSHPNVNIGLVICRQLMVVDVDTKATEQIQRYKLGQTLTVSTPRGFHFYFRNDPNVTTSTKILPEIDTRCAANYVVLPGSVNESGEPYKWVCTAEPRSLPIEFRREWRERYFQNSLTADLAFTLAPIVRRGWRNDSLWRYGRSLRSRGAGYPEIATAVSEANRDRCLPPLSRTEIDGLLDNIWNHKNRASWLLKT